jgi:hypothetical protein
MSQPSRGPQGASSGTDQRDSRLTPAPSPLWRGWAYFGATVMALMGFFWAGLGLVALFDAQYFAFRTNQLLAVETYAVWGWVHLVGGLLAVGAGVAILWGGHTWGRTAGIVVAGLSAVVNLGFLAASPVWSTIMIGFAVVIIYALTVHGWEIDEG